MRRLTTVDFPYVLPKLLEFERKSFGNYPYTPAPERLTAWWEAGAFFLAGVEQETGELDSLFTVLVTSHGELEKFVKGEIASSKQMDPHPRTFRLSLSATRPPIPEIKESAELYIPTLIVGERYWMPVLFKNLLKELNDGLKAANLTAQSVTGTAADKRAIFLMKRFGFAEVGAYKDGYKIMKATRESSVMLRNLVV